MWCYLWCFSMRWFSVNHNFDIQSAGIFWILRRRIFKWKRTNCRGYMWQGWPRHDPCRWICPARNLVESPLAIYVLLTLHLAMAIQITRLILCPFDLTISCFLLTQKYVQSEKEMLQILQVQISNLIEILLCIDPFSWAKGIAYYKNLLFIIMPLFSHLSQWPV